MAALKGPLIRLRLVKRAFWERATGSQTIFSINVVTQPRVAPSSRGRHRPNKTRRGFAPPPVRRESTRTMAKVERSGQLYHYFITIFCFYSIIVITRWNCIYISIGAYFLTPFQFPWKFLLLRWKRSNHLLCLSIGIFESRISRKIEDDLYGFYRFRVRLE